MIFDPRFQTDHTLSIVCGFFRSAFTTHKQPNYGLLLRQQQQNSDLEPTMMITRILCIFWIPLAVAVMGQLLGRIAGAFIERNNDVAEEQFLQRAMTLADLDAMDDNGDSKVSPDEFLRYMLVALQRVEKEDIDDIMAIFQKIDRDGSGLIEKSDLHANFMVGRMTRLCKSMR